MAERQKDAEDRRLESLFAFEPVPDDGFSRRVVRTIRRRIWVQRLALPMTTLLGAVIAAGPAIELMRMLGPLAAFVPEQLVSAPLELLPQVQVGVLAGMFIVTALAFARLLED